MANTNKKYSQADIKQLLDKIREYQVTVLVVGEQGTPDQESQIINDAIKNAVDYGEDWFFNERQP